MRSPAKEGKEGPHAATVELEACRQEIKWLKEEVIGQYLKPIQQLIISSNDVEVKKACTSISKRVEEALSGATLPAD